MVNPLGGVTHTKYDQFGRVTETDYPVTSVAPKETWQYDAAGNVIAHTARDGGTTNTVYDARNRPLTVTAPAATSGASRGVTITVYNDNSQPISVIDPTGAQVKHTYNVLGEVLTTDQVERYPTHSDNYVSNTYDQFGDLIKTVRHRRQRHVLPRHLLHLRQRRRGPHRAAARTRHHPLQLRQLGAHHQGR